jgi:hypothetical protein
MPLWPIPLLAGLMLALLAGVVVWQVRRRNLHLWVGGYLWNSIRRRFRAPRTAHAGGSTVEGPVTDVLLCIADHFEPSWGGATDDVADARVDAWVRDYPHLLGGFRDSDGRPPRHTFFYPIDQYIPRHVDALAALCRDGLAEVEIHLHHDNDTAENLASTLDHFTDIFAHRHGLLSRWPDGRIAYGFVHGNWALDNSRPDRRMCGVCNEVEVLRRTGCYADFTLPSAPDASQTRTINSIYYAVGRAGRCKSHDRGVIVGAAPHVPPPNNGLMLIQGPLGLWWSKRWRLPRIENGCIQSGQPPTMQRLEQWIRAGIHVPSRPDWLFVKLHTHGAKESNRSVLLGDAMLDFHRSLADRAARDSRFRFHYVTAREMYNLAKAAESGWQGPVSPALDSYVRSARPDNSDPVVASKKMRKVPGVAATPDR